MLQFHFRRLQSRDTTCMVCQFIGYYI